MGGLAAGGDTWGIPGAEFVVVYAALAVVVGAVVVGVRRWMRAGRDANPRALAADLEPRPTDVAYLNGGPRLAVLAALGALRAAGTVEVDDDGRLRGAEAGEGGDGGRAADAPAAGVGPLGRAVRDAAGRGVSRDEVDRDAAVRRGADKTARRLVSGGLLLSRAARVRQRLAALAMAAVLALGVARWVVGVQHGKPVGYLTVLVVLVALAAALFAVRAPRRTTTGERVLAELRGMHGPTLSPKMKPDWHASGPERAGMSVALFGIPAMLAGDPLFTRGLGISAASVLGASLSSWTGFGVSHAWGSDIPHSYSGGYHGSYGGGGGGCGGGGGSLGGGGGCGG